MRIRSLDQLMPFATAGELIGDGHPALVSTRPTSAARDALLEMREHDIGFLPVLDGARMVGVVSERDIARGVILEHATLVRDVMSTRVHSVGPQTEVPECLALMHRTGIRHIPVVTGDTVHGVVSIRDLMASLIERHERLLRRLHDERVTLLFPSSSY
jgi:CBS domain-containing protein